MRTFFALRPILRYLEVPTWGGILDLEYLYPNDLPRFLPVLYVSNGDLFGIHVPREGARPFIAFFAHEESRIIPITSDLDAFFLNPDRFSPDSPSWKRRNWFPIGSDRAWRRLRVDPRAGEPERELLKPLFLHDVEIGHDPDSFLCSKEPPDRTVAKLLARFPAGSDGVSRAIARRFRTVPDLRDRRRWLSLAIDLTRLRRPVDALRALENGIFVHSLYPWNGEPGRKGSIDRLWKNILEFYETMGPLARAHGDAFDRASIPRLIRFAREYAAPPSRLKRGR